MNEQKERKKTTKKISATPSAKSVTAKPWVGSSGDQGEHELLHSAMASGHPKQVIDAMVNDAADCLAHLAHAHRNDGALAAGGQQFEACQNALRRGAQADLAWVGRRLDYGSVPYSIPYFCAAAATGSVELCELFLRHEAPLECRDSDHLGPLHFATLAGSLEVSKLLIGAGANVDASDNRLRTPLYFAAVTKNRDLSELLIRAGAEVMGRDAEKRSMLHMAVFVDALDVSELLIRSGASTEAIDGLRRTPLHYAAEKKRGCALPAADGARRRR